MNANRDTVFTMEGFFDQDALKVKQDVKPSLGNVTALAGRRIPKWHLVVVDNLYGILALNDNWDSYGATRFSPEVAKSVTSLLIDIMQTNTPAPQVVPSANGSVQLEWHTAGIDLEIEVKSLFAFNVFFSDEKNEDLEWQGEINYNLTNLVHYVNLLTERSQ